MKCDYLVIWASLFGKVFARCAAYEGKVCYWKGKTIWRLRCLDDILYSITHREVFVYTILQKVLADVIKVRYPPISGRCTFETTVPQVPGWSWWIIRFPCPCCPDSGNRKSVFKETNIPVAETFIINS